MSLLVLLQAIALIVSVTALAVVVAVLFAWVYQGLKR